MASPTPLRPLDMADLAIARVGLAEVHFTVFTLELDDMTPSDFDLAVQRLRDECGDRYVTLARDGALEINTRAAPELEALLQEMTLPQSSWGPIRHYADRERRRREAAQ